MKIKPGVRIFGIRPELVLAFHIADKIFEKYGIELVITSVIDGKHSKGSLHYIGAAGDMRTRDASEAVSRSITRDLKEALGDDFDVIFEGNHIHMEFQPKLPY